MRFLCPSCKRGAHRGHTKGKCECTCNALVKSSLETLDDNREPTYDEEIEKLNKQWRDLQARYMRTQTYETFEDYQEARDGDAKS